MIYILKTQTTNDVIVFDAITSFSDSYSGSVTSHPIESGSRISDHVTVDNPKFKLNGVVSDYNFYNPTKDLVSGNVPALQYDRFNSTGYWNTANDGGYLTKDAAVPDNYTVPNASVVSSQRAVREKLIEIREQRMFVSIIEYTNDGLDSVISTISDCILTDLSFDRTPDGGQALYCSLSLEKVTLVQVKTVQADAPKIVNQTVKDQAGAGVPSLKGQQDDSTGKKDSEKTEAELETERKEEYRDAKEEEAACWNLWYDMRKKGNRTTPQCAINLKLRL